MKKIFTFIAAVLMAVFANAQSEVDIPISSGWGWGWNAETAYADGVLTATLTGDYGAVSTGWNDGTDWSKYNKLCVVLESYSNDWGKVYFSTSDGSYSPEQSFSTITSQTTVTLNFDSEKATSVKQLAVQGKATGDVIKVSRIYLVEAMEYDEGKDIEFDEWGNITSDKFAGFSDQAKVEFVVEATGEATNDNGSVLGWGIGSIASLDGSVKVGDLPLKQIGDNVYTYTIADLKAALEAPANQYNMQGINWNVWSQGKANCARKRVTVYEVKGISANIAAKVVDMKPSIRYNMAGQQVTEAYKGVVIVNGKKMIQK